MDFEIEIEFERVPDDRPIEESAPGASLKEAVWERGGRTGVRFWLPRHARAAR